MACIVCAGVKARCRNCGGFMKGAKLTTVRPDPLDLIEKFRAETVDKMIETKNKADGRANPTAEPTDNWLGDHGTN